VLKRGFDFEEHKILTEDGYILTAWRIPGEISECEQSRKNRKPVILQHGLLDTSYTWLMLNASETLPIQMAENGFDVWMTNSRGNLFSLEHSNPEYDSNIFYSKFWDFSFHEMASYDLTANVFYVKNITGFEKINYVGHSQGTVQYFIQYTLNPTFIEENIEKFVAIGTVVNVFNTVKKF
jgi:lysosomal acid lipase/cholesteryl ester hydrolase